MRSLDTFSEQSVLLSGLGSELTPLTTNLQSLVGEVRLKDQQISQLENQVAANDARNEFLLSEIIRINGMSTSILLNTIWTLTEWHISRLFF
jgi:uncharacterized protein HemX